MREGDHETLWLQQMWLYDVHIWEIGLFALTLILFLSITN